MQFNTGDILHTAIVPGWRMEFSKNFYEDIPLTYSSYGRHLRINIQNVREGVSILWTSTPFVIQVALPDLNGAIAAHTHISVRSLHPA